MAKEPSKLTKEEAFWAMIFLGVCLILACIWLVSGDDGWDRPVSNTPLPKQEAYHAPYWSDKARIDRLEKKVGDKE